MDAFPTLALAGNDVLVEVAATMALRDLAKALRVCKAWHEILDGSPHIWRRLCDYFWHSKAYVPLALRKLSTMDFASEATLQQAEEEERRDLMALKIRTLKTMLLTLSLTESADGSSNFIEKSDFVNAVLSARRRDFLEASLEAAGPSLQLEVLLKRPFLLAKAGESLPKAALRLSLADASRLRVTEEELVSTVFNVRLRNDGPLAHAIAFDPWWQGKGCGEAQFTPEGRVEFTWPEVAGEVMDPFAAMGMQNPSLGWELDLDGRLVQLLFNGHAGPQELVCRHPENWGWVLYSGGTVWASWEMPKCLDGRCSDPAMSEEALCLLPSELQRDF